MAQFHSGTDGKAMMWDTLKVATAACFLIAGSATAEDITFDISTTSGEWIQATDTNGDSPGGVDGVDSDEISWGDTVEGGDPSSYLFEDLTNGDDFAPGEGFDLGDFTHNNFPITGEDDGWLDTAQLKVDVTNLEASGEEDEFTTDITSVFTFDHLETTNDQDPCPDGGENGVGVNENGCADRVTIIPRLADTDLFRVNDSTFRVDIAGFEDEDGDLVEEFWTQEDAENVATLRGVVTEVPAPAPLPLLGLGLLALGFTLRRKNPHEG